jgi:hypothetical protein
VLRLRLAAVCVSLVSVLLAVGPAHAACTSAGEKFEPADGKTLVMIGQDMDSIDKYVAGGGGGWDNTGSGLRLVPGGTMLYVSIAAPNWGLDAPASIGAGINWAQYEAITYPQSALQVGVHLAGQLDNTIAGVHDASITAMATFFKRIGVPVYVRLGYEFDGPHNAYEPAKFVAAWRHIVDRLRNVEGVTNAAFVWQSFAATPTFGNQPIAAWYPGDAYVDWAGVSMYGQAFSNGAGLGPAHAVADFADAHNKPLMIAESAPRGRQMDQPGNDLIWNDWFVPTIDFVQSRNVKAWSYVNADWDSQPFWMGQGWGDTRIPASGPAKANWLALMGTSRYLNASPTLFCDLGYAP